jgi:hypothetical protein
MTPQSTRDRRNIKHVSLARKPWMQADEGEEPPVAS